MKWFGHLSNTHEQESICALIDEHGMAGYGMYWIVKEKIAQKMGVDNLCSVTFSIKNWASFAKVSCKKFEKFAKTLSELSLFEIEIIDKKMKITSQEMLDLRDEYTKKQLRKSGQYPDNIPTSGRTLSAIDINTDINRDKEKDLLLQKGESKHQGKIPWLKNDYFNDNNSIAAWLFTNEQCDKIMKKLQETRVIFDRNLTRIVDEIAYSIFVGYFRETRIKPGFDKNGNPNNGIEKAINSAIKTIQKKKQWNPPQGYTQSSSQLVYEQLRLEGQI